jgi:preprotein translocase subunit Sss1
VKAVILIFKHASFLWLSNESHVALTLAEVDYQKANIDLKIQEYLKASSPEPSVEEFTHFIMATDIGMLIVTFAIKISHQASSFISVLGQKHQCKENN